MSKGLFSYKPGTDQLLCVSAQVAPNRTKRIADTYLWIMEFLCRTIPPCYPCATFLRNWIIHQTISWWAPQLRSKPCDMICPNVLFDSLQRAPARQCRAGDGGRSSPLLPRSVDRPGGCGASHAVGMCWQSHTIAAQIEKTANRAKQNRRLETRTVNPSGGQCLLDHKWMIMIHINT